MPLTPIGQTAGKVLARDIPSPGANQQPLLRAGFTLNDGIIVKLSEKGVREVYVDEPIRPDAQPQQALLPPKVQKQTVTKVCNALDAARDAFASKQSLAPDVIADMQRVVDRISKSLLDSPPSALAMFNLAAADEYTHNHSVNVTSLGLLLARAHWGRHGWTDYRGTVHRDRIEERLTILGLGLLLHDVGKMAIPLEVLNKPGRLDDAERALMNTHPDAGYELLRRSPEMSPLVLGVVRDHHERWDGQGYPNKIAGNSIHEFSRIAAVADVYDAVTSKRPYKEAQPSRVGLDIILQGRGTAFDPSIVDTFQDLILPYPVGDTLTLPDGRLAVISSVDPAAPLMPRVKVSRRFQRAAEYTVDMRSGEPQLLAA